MALPNMSIIDRALEVSTSAMIQPHLISMIQEEEQDMIQGEEQDMIHGEEQDMIDGEEQDMIQGEEHDIDAVAYPQNLQPPPGAPAPPDEREEQGAHSISDIVLNCDTGESGCLSNFQESEHYRYGDNSSSDCDAPEDDSSDEETENDDVAIADRQSNPVNVQEQENRNEDFPLRPIHLEDEGLKSENGVNNEVPLSDSKQELQSPQSHTSALQTHATLDQLISYPSLASSTSTVEEEGTASTFNRAAEEPENDTPEEK